MNNKPTVVFMFNSSPYAPMPWLEDGLFNVVSIDYTDTDHSDAHVQWEHPLHHRINMDLTKADPWDVEYALAAQGLARPSFVMSFAPCTDLAVSGAAHFEKKRTKDPLFQQKAVDAAMLASYFDCPYAVENPVSVLSTLWRKPDAYWHPWHYAGYCPTGEHPEFPQVFPEQDRYNKKTGLWCGNGFIVPPLDPLDPLEKDFPGHRALGGKSGRTKYIRSLTPRGFAKAVFVYNNTPALMYHFIYNRVDTNG